MQLHNVFSEAEEIALYKDGVRGAYECGSEKFEEIIAEWNAMFKDSVIMPAFGVSINDWTVKEMKSGAWIEFAFASQLTINGMPFAKLLIAVKPEYKGFNIVRYTAEHGYAGRCYYVDLRGGDMADFYNYMMSVD